MDTLPEQISEGIISHYLGPKLVIDIIISFLQKEHKSDMKKD